MGEALSISNSETYASVKRAQACQRFKAVGPIANLGRLTRATLFA